MLESKDGHFQYEIRPAVESDLEYAISSWWELVEEQTMLDDRAKKSQRNIKQSEWFLTSLIERELLILAIESSNKIIGIGTISPDNFFLEGGPSVWNIADVWVSKKYRRNGVANNLVDYLQKSAIRLGANEIRLGVYSENTAALALYSSLGYRRLKETLQKKV